MEKKIGKLAYIQKRNRYFWKNGATTKYNEGFRSKEECDIWINSKRDELLFDWRCGFMVKFRKLEHPLILVNRKGEEVKAF